MSSSETVTRTAVYSSSADSDSYKSGIQPRGSAIKDLAGNATTIMAFTGDMHSPLAVVATREREKRELSDLNDRLCNYIEAVRFLEFHNKKLTSDVEFYKSKLERLNVVIRQIFETELNQARDIIDDNRREKERLDDRHSRLDRDAQDIKERYHFSRVVFVLFYIACVFGNVQKDSAVVATVYTDATIHFCGVIRYQHFSYL